MTEKITYYLVDDHQLFRDGMKRILNEEPDFLCIGESGFGIHAINEIQDLKPNIVLLDVNLPDVNGDYVCRKIKRNSPISYIIIISMHDDIYMIKELREAGADFYLLKSKDSSAVVKTMRSLMNGDSLEQLIDVENDNELTSKEKVILSLICKEKTSTEIAKILNCSLKTVETHRKNLFQKTNSKNVVGLVKYALKHKIDIH